MKHLWKTMPLLLILMIAFQPLAHAQSPTEKADNVEVIGVLMYADWCGKCKQLDPKLSKVTPEFKGKPILFTRFDMTNDFTTSQSGKLADLLGLGELFKQHKGSTGYMVLVDAETGEPLKTLKHKQSKIELKQSIASVLNQ